MFYNVNYYVNNQLRRAVMTYSEAVALMDSGAIITAFYPVK